MHERAEHVVGSLHTQRDGRGASPFLKWIGGKRLHLDAFSSLFPLSLQEGDFDTYCEPFLGGGAVFLHVASQVSFRRVLLSDINPDLVLTYQVVQSEVDALIEELEGFVRAYFDRPQEEQRALYNGIRATFNGQRGMRVEDGLSRECVVRAAQFIFLNKAGYGGMFRVNRKGDFNVPFGKHKRPQILDADNLKRASALLQGATIRVADFATVTAELAQGSFVYFDPPYRPLNATSQFTRYHGAGFGDEDQQKLAAQYRRLDERGACLMLSNSDPKNEDPEDTFFDDLYEGFEIHRVMALRKINSNFAKRGRKTELVITNYEIQGCPSGLAS